MERVEIEKEMGKVYEDGEKEEEESGRERTTPFNQICKELKTHFSM